MAEKAAKPKKPKRIKINVIPPTGTLCDLTDALLKNGFLVVPDEGGNPRKAAEAALRAADGVLRGAFCIVKKEDAAELWGVPYPDEDRELSIRINRRRWHPDDIFEDFKVASEMVAPVYGLAGAIAAEFGVKTEWNRDAEAPMRAFVTQYVEAPAEEQKS